MTCGTLMHHTFRGWDIRFKRLFLRLQVEINEKVVKLSDRPDNGLYQRPETKIVTRIIDVEGMKGKEPKTGWILKPLRAIGSFVFADLRDHTRIETWHGLRQRLF